MNFVVFTLTICGWGALDDAIVAAVAQAVVEEVAKEGNFTSTTANSPATSSALPKTQRPELQTKTSSGMECSCPCKTAPKEKICARTTSGKFQTFDSLCQLICSNQCEMSERYAVITQKLCYPPASIYPPDDWHSEGAGVKETVVQIGGNNEHLRRVVQEQEDLSSPPTCDCSYCPKIKWIRTDYYPICAERAGQKVTMESWCHFDCENKCIQRGTGGPRYLYQHKGNCEKDIYDAAYWRKIENGEDFCSVCGSYCQHFFEPICGVNMFREYLSFPSLCHMNCHNGCYFQSNGLAFQEIYAGYCK